LRFFDQISFYPVSEDELLRIRRDFPLGRYRLKIEPARFRLRDYNAFLTDNKDSIATFKSRQQSAFDAERERWAAQGTPVYASDAAVAESSPDVQLDLPPNARAVAAQVAGNLWKLEVSEGDAVLAGAVLAIVESMKMEIAVTAPCDGRVFRLFCREGAPVTAGQDLMVLVAEPG
jgi:urea carboxylase